MDSCDPVLCNTLYGSSAAAFPHTVVSSVKVRREIDFSFQCLWIGVAVELGLAVDCTAGFR